MLVVQEPKDPKIAQLVEKYCQSPTSLNLFAGQTLMRDFRQLHSSVGEFPRYYAFRRCFVALYQQRLKILQISDVDPQRYASEHPGRLVAVRKQMSESIADLMLFHQMFSSKQVVQIYQKSMDLNSGAIISLVHMNWEPPVSPDGYRAFVQTGATTECALEKGLQPKDALRVVIDKWTLHILRPHGAIGYISNQLLTKIRRFAVNAQVFDLSYITQVHEVSSFDPSNLSVDFSGLVRLPVAQMLFFWQCISGKSATADQRIPIMQGADVMCRCLQSFISSLKNDEDKRNLMLQNIDGLASSGRSADEQNRNQCVEWVIDAIAGFYI